MVEEKNTKETTDKISLENTAKVGDRLTFAHELIEVLAGSIALIAPAILLILWLYRVGICNFYGLPIFYSSLNIIRFLPVIIIAVLFVMYSWLIDNADFSKIISVKATLISQKNEKKRDHGTGHMKGAFTLLLFITCELVLFLVLVALIQEITCMIKGKYPFFFKNDDQSEAGLVFLLAIVAISVDIRLLILAKRGRIDWDKILEDGEVYISRRIQSLRIRISTSETMSLTMKHFMNCGLVIHLIVSVFILIIYIAVGLSYFNTSYYMVKFDDAQYAIVLDTDDYYIGEPIQIIQHEDERELIIQTNAYIYLDKAENPIVVRKEAFDIITILRE